MAFVPVFFFSLLLAIFVGTGGETVSGSVLARLTGQAAPAYQLGQYEAEPLASAEFVRPVQPDCSAVSCLALTFDDGPNPATTPQILDELKQAGVPATFFVIGSRVPGNEALLKRMYAEGHEIGSHSWTHPDLTKLPPEQIKQQVDLTQAAVVASGVPAPTLFRPPYGAINQTVQDNVSMTLLLWNEDPHDWAANSPEQVVQAVDNTAKKGAIIDLHDIYHVTANALPTMITHLKAKGYHFVTASQLLNLTPESRGIFYGHP